MGNSCASIPSYSTAEVSSKPQLTNGPQVSPGKAFFSLVTVGCRSLRACVKSRKHVENKQAWGIRTQGPSNSNNAGSDRIFWTFLFPSSPHQQRNTLLISCVYIASRAKTTSKGIKKFRQHSSGLQVHPYIHPSARQEAIKCLVPQIFAGPRTSQHSEADTSGHLPPNMFNAVAAHAKRASPLP